MSRIIHPFEWKSKGNKLDLIELSFLLNIIFPCYEPVLMHLPNSLEEIAMKVKTVMNIQFKVLPGE